MNTINPFVVTFGKKPANYISRPKEFEKIIFDLEQEPASIQSYLITGVRGSGKTVLMNAITSHFTQQDEWIVVKINPERDILTSLASKLYDLGSSKHLFTKMSLSVNIYGISLSITGSNPITDVESILDRLFASIKKHNKKVLIAIDEVSNSSYIKVFAHTFQTLLGEDMPIYLIMTGLYENVLSLQNEKTLTFLYRSPIIELKPLDIIDIALSYQKIFNIDKEKSIVLSKLTSGYAFAYQALGYILFDQNKIDIDKDTLDTYDSFLRKFSYDKMWDSCSEIEKNILKQINKDGITTNECITNANISKSVYSVYRERLINKGLIDTSIHGIIKFSLPRFYEFVKNKIEFNLD